MTAFVPSLSPIPEPRGSFGHHRWLCNQFPPLFSVLHCPLGLDELQACLFLDVVFPSLLLSALSSPPFTVPSKMVLDRPDELERCWYYFSLHLFTMVRKSHVFRLPAGSASSSACPAEPLMLSTNGDWWLFYLQCWQRLHHLLRQLPWSFLAMRWKGCVIVDILVGHQLLFRTGIPCCCWRGLHWWPCHRGVWCRR